MRTVTADQRQPGQCGWQTAYGTGNDQPRYCTEPASPSGLCPAHERLARDGH